MRTPTLLFNTDAILPEKPLPAAPRRVRVRPEARGMAAVLLIPPAMLVAGAFMVSKVLEAPDGRRDTLGLVCGGLFATAWCGFVLALTAAVWVGAHLDRWFVRYGTPAVGEVVRKRPPPPRWEAPPRRAHFSLSYRYPLANGELRYGEARVSRELYAALRDGQPVLVLYDPARPLRSRLYAALHHEPVLQ